MARGMGEVGGNCSLGVGGADIPARDGVRARSTTLVGVRRALLAEQFELILLVLGVVVSESSFLLGTIHSDIASVRYVDLAEDLLLVSGIGCMWLFVFSAVLLLFGGSFLG